MVFVVISIHGYVLILYLYLNNFTVFYNVYQLY